MAAEFILGKLEGRDLAPWAGVVSVGVPSPNKETRMWHPGAKDWFYCEACDKTYIFQGNESPGFKEPDQDIRCPHCHEVLGHLRCDVNRPLLLREWDGRHIGRLEDE